MCIRDRAFGVLIGRYQNMVQTVTGRVMRNRMDAEEVTQDAVSYTHLRAHETVLDLVCRLLLEIKKDSFISIYSYFPVSS